MSEHRVISLGGDHSLVITPQGQVYSFGGNISRQLGLDDRRNRFEPTLIPNLPKAKSVAAGGGFSLVLTEDGQVYAFGQNYNGQLGLGLTSAEVDPTVIPNLPPIKSLSEGASSVIDQEGRVWAFGDNSYGRLGLSGDNRIVVPTIVPDLPPIKMAVHSDTYSLFLDYQGNVYACGNNEDGSLGLGDRLNRAVPEIIPNLPPISKITVGADHSLVLTNDGQVYSFGDNQSGKLGLGDQSEVEEGIFGSTVVDRNRDAPILIPRLPVITDIAAGRDHTIVLDRDGHVYAFGRSNYGQLGYRTQQSGVTRPVQIPNLFNIVAVACGDFFTLVLDDQGVVRSFGMNTQGQLGLGSRVGRDVFSPQIISGLVARLPSSEREELVENKPYITSYPIIRYLLDHVPGIDYTIVEQGDRVTSLEFVLPDGTILIAFVNYDPVNDQIFPLRSADLEDNDGFSVLEMTINQGFFKFAFRPDLYQDEFGNQGFEFEAGGGVRYLIRVYVGEDGQIYRPVSS